MTAPHAAGRTRRPARRPPARAGGAPPRPPAWRGRPVPFLDAARAVLATELRGLARDRRAVVLSLLLPVALYPLIFFLNGWLEDVAEETLAARSVRVALILEGAPEELAARLRERLAQEIPIALSELPEEEAARLSAAVERGTPDALEVEREELGRLTGPEGNLLVHAVPHPLVPGRVVFRLVYDGASELGNEALARAERALEDVEREARAQVLVDLFGADPAAPLELEAVDVASDQDRSGAAIGRLLPLIAVLVLLSGGSYAALAAFAGEREAGTLETLLVQPIEARAAVWGKFAAVLCVGVLSLVLNMGSVLGCLALGIGSLPGVAADAGALSVGLARGLAGAAVFLPACVLVCAVLALVCGRARTFREGQNYLLPLLLAAMAPCALATQPEVELDLLLAAVPLAGAALAFRDALTGNLVLAPAVASVCASVLWSWLALSRLAPLLEAERVLAHRDSRAEQGLRHVQSRRALAYGLGGVLAVYLVGGLLQAADALWGLVATLWLLLPLLALRLARGTAARAGEPTWRALELRPPAAHHALGALLVAPALVELARALFAWQQRLLPLPSTLSAESAVPAALRELPALGAVLVLAVSPGICEELFFRGAVLSGLRRDLPWRKVVAWQALLFGAVHASIHRFLATALLGGLLAALTLRARSVWPAVLLHVSYNTLLILGDEPRLRELLAGREPWLAAAGLALVLLPARRAPRGGPSA